MANKDNVKFGINAVVSIIPDGTVPTSTASIAGEIDLGYITEDGITITASADRTEVAMLGGDIVRVLKRNPKVEYAFTLGEVTAQGMALFFGRAADGSGKIAWDPSVSWRGSLRVDVLDYVDGSDDLQVVATHFIPDGEVTANEALTIKDDSPYGHGVTVTAYKQDGRCADVFYKDLATAA